jgi:hypothetical protein
MEFFIESSLSVDSGEVATDITEGVGMVRRHRPKMLFFEACEGASEGAIDDMTESVGDEGRDKSSLLSVLTERVGGVTLLKNILSEEIR